MVITAHLQSGDTSKPSGMIQAHSLFSEMWASPGPAATLICEEHWVAVAPGCCSPFPTHVSPQQPKWQVGGFHQSPCTHVPDSLVKGGRRRMVSRASVPGSTVCKIEGLKILTQVSRCQLTEAHTAPSLFGIPAANTGEPSKWGLHNHYDLQNGSQNSAKLCASVRDWGRLELAGGFWKRHAVRSQDIWVLHLMRFLREYDENWVDGQKTAAMSTSTHCLLHIQPHRYRNKTMRWAFKDGTT